MTWRRRTTKTAADCRAEGCTRVVHVERRLVDGAFEDCPRRWCLAHCRERALVLAAREQHGQTAPVYRIEDYERDPETGVLHRRRSA